MTPIRVIVAVVGNSLFVRSTVDITSHAEAGYDAFVFLKQAAATPNLPNLYPELPPEQTTLGQFFPEVPSRYGPMTYVRTNRMGDMPAIRSQGLVPQNQLGGHNEYWDTDEGLFSPEDKQFDMTRGDGKGFFLTKPHPRNIRFASTGADKGGLGLVGVRMSPEEARQMDMQTRTADESPEDLPEMLMHERIPPERLVMMPQPSNVAQGVDYHDPSTYGNVPLTPTRLGRERYGIDSGFVDRNAPPDAQGRAFNFDELLGEF